jgi:hypothetical protein
MAVRVAKIDAAAAVPVIEFTVVEAPRRAAIGELRLPDAAEDRIELGIADVEGVMVALELLVVIEKERECVVDTYWRKMPVFQIGVKAKNPREKLGRCHLIAAGTMVWLRVMVIGRPLATNADMSTCLGQTKQAI